MGGLEKVIDAEGRVFKPLEGGDSGWYGEPSAISRISFGLGLRLLAETDSRWPL